MKREDPSPWQPPATFGEYRLVRPLGRGAMGEVYLAHDTVLDRWVAVKFITGVAPDEVQRERFRTEARAIARVQHPNVVGIHRVGEVRDRPYLVSEFLRGESLDRLARPVPWERVLELGIGLSRGLAAAHRQGVLHRDLKPANALLTKDGQVKLLDFGVAKLLDVAGGSAGPANLSDSRTDLAEGLPEGGEEASRRSMATGHGGGDGPEASRWAAAAARSDVDAVGATPILASANRATLASVGSLPRSAPEQATADLPRDGAADAAHRTATITPPAKDLPSRPLDLLSTGRIGTPLYMAPEVWRGEPATARSDLFSLGVLLHELCGGLTPGPLADAPLEPRTFTPLDRVVPGIDPAFASVVMRCLAHEPSERFDSAEALREALESIAARRSATLGHAAAPARVRPRWLRVTRVVALPFLAAALLLGGNWYGERSRRLDAEQALASVAPLLDEGRVLESRIEALRAEAFTAFDSDRVPIAEDTWSQALALGVKQARRYEEATAILDTARMRVGAGRSDPLEQRLADLLLQRILVAERDRKPEARAALLQRLDEVDPSGVTSHKLTAPVRVDLDSDPPGAVVQVESLEPITGEPPGPWTFGTTPITSGLTLSPGSYRLTFTRPDRPPVRYPVLLGRGGVFQARVVLPKHVPDGYVYVPPGRFLYGSGDDESIRRTVVRTRPLHPLTTGAFLIARHEVTYADWLTWLRALPTAERAARRPRGTNYFGTIELLPNPDDTWTFHLEHEGVAYHAREGEPLRYQDRQLRAEQDWRRFPVSGISWEDARAYVAWLDATGRLPRARLCTEREWERAARGADGRDYPHGPTLAPDDANFDATYGRKPRAFGPDAVGSHPRSDSPFGVADQSGNVWEWLVTDTAGTPAYGGGSFYQDALTARVLNHGDGEPRTRFPFIGMRVCASVP
ncbi:SUMF1/EgtB/PvdO family nonheme iron enzyme [Corallococcus sp. ZKHCc1 1396]|uniref:SUMF1/EgtB/PvdO family nonheme iron enzyme n=2 Tax=Corallococcus soli TaxID=2710757 RepID=A0ABR9PNQ0_9BACT|nr:bifunctional serine/threonine-protein kinase/formylglycine-generating enzyme family protein [Corallococcus soli]MBE4749550.1 SUMF1/EgtB/PvdO family nonheme iron enzyme [Corallococcus soli]